MILGTRVVLSHPNGEQRCFVGAGYECQPIRNGHPGTVAKEHERDLVAVAFDYGPVVMVEKTNLVIGWQPRTRSDGTDSQRYRCEILRS
jgi:hypothetical protein